MRFEASEKTLDGLDTIRLRDTAAGGECAILPPLGGTVRRLLLPPAPTAASGEPTQVLEEDPPDEILLNPGFRGRILFPFNDRIPGGLYRFEGHEFRLPQNEPESECAIHGLIYDRRCRVVNLSANDTEARLTLSYHMTPDEFPGYPFDLLFQAHYRLSENGFDLRLEARNTGTATAPISMGWHPYIATPEGVNAARLTCPARRYVEVDDYLLPTGALPDVSGTSRDFRAARLIGEQELDIALERSNAVGDVVDTVTTLVDRGHDTVAVQQSIPPFRFTQLFVPPSRKAVAVEPVTAATNAFNHAELGLTRLQAGEWLRGSVRVSTAMKESISTSD